MIHYMQGRGKDEWNSIHMMHMHSIWKIEFIWNGKSICKSQNMMTCTKHLTRSCTELTSLPLKGVCPLSNLRTKTPIATSSLTIYQSHDDHPQPSLPPINRQSNVSPRPRLQVFESLARQPCNDDKFSQRQANAHKRNIALKLPPASSCIHISNHLLSKICKIIFIEPFRSI